MAEREAQVVASQFTELKGPSSNADLSSAFFKILLPLSIAAVDRQMNGIKAWSSWNHEVLRYCRAIL